MRDDSLQMRLLGFWNSERSCQGIKIEGMGRVLLVDLGDTHLLQQVPGRNSLRKPPRPVRVQEPLHARLRFDGGVGEGGAMASRWRARGGSATHSRWMLR